ncbi:hypothetical protein Csa_003863 [Cucumis sativus]|nr:hypothetical protein Csa_003863 [Cucumis sativus]
MYKGMSRSRSFSEKMGGAVAPLAIGTRGTVGSLVMKEIEYFTKLELERHGISHTISGNALRRSDSRGSFWLLSLTWKWKKRKGNNGVLPNISSAVEFSKSNRFNGIPEKVIGYKISTMFFVPMLEQILECWAELIFSFIIIGLQKGPLACEKAQAMSEEKVHVFAVVFMRNL